MRIIYAIITTGLLTTSPTLLMAEKQKEKSEAKPHCEKVKDGKSIHIDEAKTRRECKKKGGRWVKGHKKEKGDHGHNHDAKEKEHHDH